MTARAFVIAIEDYSKGTFLPSLPGCNADAEIFIRWLLDKKGVKPEDIRCCSGKSVRDGKELKWRTTGTTSGEIVDELGKCMTDWADKTEEFYFFFSGHGFSTSTTPWEKSIDVLVASEFKDTLTGGRACLKLSELQSKLYLSLGPKHHYYFIDACRNQIDTIAPAESGLGPPRSQLGTPTVYKIFSTARGTLSNTQSGFTPLLVKGLSGRGRAKGVRPPRMFVIFDLLGEYMKKGLKPSGQDVDYDREGNGEGHILELNPIPQTKCEINVARAKPTDAFTLTISDIKGPRHKHKFKGGSFKVSLFPDDYFLELTHPLARVVQKAPPPPDPVDLYDECVVSFELKPALPKPVAAGAKKASKKMAKPKGGAKSSAKGGDFMRPSLETAVLGLQEFAQPAAPPQPAAAPVPAAAPASPSPKTTATLHLKAPQTPHTRIEVMSLKTGEVTVSDFRAGDFTEEVPPGEYVVKLRERGVTVRRSEVTLKPGEEKTLKLIARPRDKVRDTILKAVRADDAGGASVFSESSLGPLASTDLGLWLSLFGASRILGEPGQFQKLERLPLATFDDVKKDEAAVYALAGFEKSAGRFGVGVSPGKEVRWEPLEEVKGLHKIYERRLPAAPGAHLLSLKIPKQPPVTFAVHCLPNRATLCTFAEDREGRLTFHQFLLPMRHLKQYLEPAVRSYLNQNMLGVVRTMALAHSQFARKRSVQEQLQGSDLKVWNDLVNHKWLDPVMALIAAYDVIRHGSIEQAKRLLGVVNSNLRKYFEGMADVEAIAKLLGTQWDPPGTAPLLLDGVLAFDDAQVKKMLPLPPGLLDYKSPWTAWRGAVNDFAPPTGARKSGG